MPAEPGDREPGRQSDADQQETEPGRVIDRGERGRLGHADADVKAAQGYASGYKANNPHFAIDRDNVGRAGFLSIEFGAEFRPKTLARIARIIRDAREDRAVAIGNHQRRFLAERPRFREIAGEPIEVERNVDDAGDMVRSIEKRQSHWQNRLFEAPDQVLADREPACVLGLLKELSVGGGRTRQDGNA